MTLAGTATTLALVVTVATAAVLPTAAGAAAPGEGPPLEPVEEGTTWREVLGRAVTATVTGFEASMVVVSLGEDGPGVTEVELRKDTDGSLRVAAAEAWLIAREGASAMFRDEAGELVRLGQVQALPFTLPEVRRNYGIEVVGRASLLTGPAIGLGFRRDDVLRERLFVDDATGLVVRRETYDGAGAPVRVMALTELRVTDREMRTMEAAGDVVLGDRERLSPAEVRELSGHGWDVPVTVGDGFELRAGFAVDDGAAVQLVYSDGLYTLSVLEQPGRVDPDALEGAVRTERDGIPVYRWPGVEPERMVWNGGEHTFTAVTDAPADILMAAIDDLPHDSAIDLPTRLRRGMSRLGRLLWPFD